MNSLRNKFTDFKELILNETDLFFIPESKLDNAFPNAQFENEGCRLFCKDRNKFGDGTVLFIKEHIPRKIIYCHKFPAGIEIICFEFSISNKNGFKPPS